MDSPDIVKAQTTLEERPDLARKVHTVCLCVYLYV